MKVLHIITKSNWGGAQRHVFDLVMHQKNMALDVSVACGVENGKAPLVARLKPANIPVYEISSLGRDIHFARDISTVFEIYRLLKKVRPDVVHLHSSKVGLLGALAARAAGTPKIIFTAHGTPFNEDRNILPKTIIYLLSYLTVLLSKHTICVSNKVLHDYPKLFCKYKMSVVHNGMDEPIFFSEKDARELLKISLEGYIIGTIAELHPNKGLLTLLKAIPLLKENHPAFSLHIIGGGEQEVELRKYIAENNLNAHVIMHGFVTDAYRYLPAFDIFVLPSINEGLPYVLLEAALAGVPIIASDVGGVSEVVKGDVTGLLVKRNNPKMLAEKLNSLMGDSLLSKSLTENMQRHVKTEFSEEQMLKKIIALYSA